MKSCCEKPENRIELERLGDDLTVERCKVCGRRHYELTVDPGFFGVVAR